MNTKALIPFFAAYLVISHAASLGTDQSPFLIAIQEARRVADNMIIEPNILRHLNTLDGLVQAYIKELKAIHLGKAIGEDGYEGADERYLPEVLGQISTDILRYRSIIRNLLGLPAIDSCETFSSAAARIKSAGKNLGEISKCARVYLQHLSYWRMMCEEIKGEIERAISSPESSGEGGLEARRRIIIGGFEEVITSIDSYIGEMDGVGEAFS